MAKKQKVAVNKIEKILTYIGVALALIGSVSSVYYTAINIRFLNGTFLSIFHYLSYLIVLGGGFAGGYLLTTKKSGASRANKLYSGATYALIAVSLYFFMDVIRLFTRDLLQFNGLDNILFDYSTVVALAITLIVIFMLQTYKKKVALASTAKWILIVSFITTQVYYLVSQIYYTVMPPAGVDTTYAAPLWLTILSYVANPLIITALAYFVLKSVKSKLSRLFYATFAAAFIYYLFVVVWNFQTDVSIESINLYQAVLSIVMVFMIAGLLWKLRRVAK